MYNNIIIYTLSFFLWKKSTKISENIKLSRNESEILEKNTKIKKKT